MKQQIIILGAGRMARALVFDLHEDFDLTIADVNSEALTWFETTYNIKTLCFSVTDEAALKLAVAPFDLVIGCVPGQFGFGMLQTVLEEGKNIVDISFAPENVLELNELAIQNNALAIVDIGVAPGLSNIILGHEYATNHINKFVCMVGGLPKKREWPFEYKAPFSPIDVIEEYTRPSRIVRNGKIITLDALTESELVQLNGIELEAFITDGLRSVLETIDIPNMEEKTLRYPGHRALMEVFRETGLFSKEVLKIKNQAISPLDVTTKLLLPKWKLGEHEEEFTIMTLDFEGEVNKRYLLYDEFNSATGLSSMARTTGFTCATAARMVLKGLMNKTGVLPPERIGQDVELYNFMLEGLKKHGIVFKIETKNI